MPLVSGKEVLNTANKEGYAVGAFNFNNMEVLQAIIETAIEESAPVIVETSEGAMKYAGTEMLYAMTKVLADKAKIPIVLHVDHGKNFEEIMKALHCGYTSVMIDASSHSLDENIAITRRVVEIAHAMDVSVEAELGTLKGVEDNVSVAERDAILVKPEEAERFVTETGVDSLAPAIGTSHGAFKFKGKPKLDFDRLIEVKKLTGIPLVLHGASSVPAELIDIANTYGAQIPGAKGIPDEFVKKAVEHGINKMNVDTDLRMAMVGAVRKTLAEKPGEFDPRKYLGPARDAIKRIVKRRIELLGSKGKA